MQFNSGSPAAVHPIGGYQIQHQQSQYKILYCLDFDGVLCDSVHETFLSGWRACKLLWKKNGESNAKSDWIDAIEGDPEKIRQLEEDFRYVRPILYVGWESILLLRLLSAGYTNIGKNDDENILAGCGDPSSVRDAVFQGFHSSSSSSSSSSLKERALGAWGFASTDYGDAMSVARKTWIAEDETSWIDAHGFYGDACEAVRRFLRSKGDSDDVYVITTKAKEFALRLLEKQDLYRSGSENEGSSSSYSSQQNVRIQKSHVFGLGSGPKASVLQQILEERQTEEEGGTKNNCVVAVMVEDNIATLNKISVSPVGNKVLPVVASWGYNSIEQLAGVLRLDSANNCTNHINSRNNSSMSHPPLPYVVLPLLEEFSSSACDTLDEARNFAKKSKRTDPTGSSLASILQSPFDAGPLMTTGENGDGLYDFFPEGGIPAADPRPSITRTRVKS